MPYDVWLASLSPAELRAYGQKKMNKQKGGRKRVYGKRRTYRNARRGGRSQRVQAGPFATFYGYGDYASENAVPVRDPMKKIDPRTDYAFKEDYGSRLGSVLGEGIQSFAHALGFGDYNITSNSCLTHKYLDMGTSPPRVKNTNKGEATVFSHREYLGDLLTGVGVPSAFTLQTYSINPGNSELFPFCSKLAENFQEWEVRGMLVELKSLASNTTTALSMGSMFAAVDYNSLDPAPTSKIELENLEYACSQKPSETILMPVECARSNDVLTHLYVAVDEDYQAGDKRLYDLGTLYVGSYGCPAAEAPIAEIWVTYEIAMYKPHLHPDPPLPPVECPVYGGHWKGSTGIGLNIFANSIMSGGSSAGFDVTSSGGNGIVEFPSTYIDAVDTRHYLVSAAWRGASAFTPVAPTVGFSSNPDVEIYQVTNFFSGIASNNAQTFCYSPTSASVSVFTMQFVVKVVSNAAVTTKASALFIGGTWTADVTSYWDCTVTELSSDVINLVKTVEETREDGLVQEIYEKVLDKVNSGLTEDAAKQLVTNLLAKK
jgi:hypothetical protein